MKTKQKESPKPKLQPLSENEQQALVGGLPARAAKASTSNRIPI
ncbi:hypothetical protein [Argonema galeatum]|nr:hypothetical protein [Argonema galeatum]